MIKKYIGFTKSRLYLNETSSSVAVHQCDPQWRKLSIWEIRDVNQVLKFMKWNNCHCVGIAALTRPLIRIPV